MLKVNIHEAKTNLSGLLLAVEKKGELVRICRDGVPIAERREELKCGVAAVDLRRGVTIGLLEFQTAIEEIFDVQVLAGLQFPEIVGFQKEAIDHTFVVPPNDI